MTRPLGPWATNPIRAQSQKTHRREAERTVLQKEKLRSTTWLTCKLAARGQPRGEGESREFPRLAQGPGTAWQLRQRVQALCWPQEAPSICGSFLHR